MTKKDYVLGIDMGTSSVKVGLFDMMGNPVAFADESYPLYTPKPGGLSRNRKNGGTQSARRSVVWRAA